MQCKNYCKSKKKIPVVLNPDTLRIRQPGTWVDACGFLRNGMLHRLGCSMVFNFAMQNSWKTGYEAWSGNDFLGKWILNKCLWPKWTWPAIWHLLPVSCFWNKDGGLWFSYGVPAVCSSITHVSRQKKSGHCRAPGRNELKTDRPVYLIRVPRNVYWTGWAPCFLQVQFPSMISPFTLPCQPITPSFSLLMVDIQVR